ncbi:MAG: glycosyltransferase family 2 protein [Clostridiales bacterium]|jgi:GT2 family glycosyltransferase|nr:glycosyltransferase family 2 protein [Clostridiales bacterium]
MIAKVRVIIPNLDGENWLPKCLDALFKQDYTNFSVTMVDNGSMDDSVKLVGEKYPQVEIVKHTKNIGICAAVNEIVVRAQEDYIVVLHNDAVTEPEWLRCMVAQMAEDERIFALAPVHVYQHNPTRVKQAGMGYTLGGTAFGLNLGKKLSKIKAKNVFAVSDCGTMYRRDIFLHLNGYDENFFVLGHDVDICWRAAKAGYKNVICPEARLVRFRELGAIDPDTRARLEARNNEWTIYKNLPFIQKFCTTWILGAAKSRRAALTKSAKKSYKQGLTEGRKTRRKMCKKFRPKGAFGRNIRIKWSMARYTFVNMVRFPK